MPILYNNQMIYVQRGRPEEIFGNQGLAFPIFEEVSVRRLQEYLFPREEQHGIETIMASTTGRDYQAVTSSTRRPALIEL